MIYYCIHGVVVENPKAAAPTLDTSVGQDGHTITSTTPDLILRSTQTEAAAIRGVHTGAGWPGQARGRTLYSICVLSTNSKQTRMRNNHHRWRSSYHVRPTNNHHRGGISGKFEREGGYRRWVCRAEALGSEARQSVFRQRRGGAVLPVSRVWGDEEALAAYAAVHGHEVLVPPVHDCVVGGKE